MRSNNRILHGMRDIAGQGSYSAQGLRKIGEDATVAVWRRNPFGYKVDIDLKIDKERAKTFPYFFVAGFKMLSFAVRASASYDIFHFHFSDSLLPYGLDLLWLKILKKRMIMEFHGDDIRYFYNREMPKYYPYDKLVTRGKRDTLTNNRVLKYVDTVITHDEELRKHIPHGNLFITPLRIDVERFIPAYPEENKKKITIVHAPSDYIVKGSKYVLKSIEELKKEFDIEFILVEKKTQEEAFELYKKADIIIDQLLAQTYGVFAVEAMAMGKPVVCWISDEVRKTFPDELPIVNATIDDLTDKLRDLIKDGKKRRELGIAGRAYAEHYHDYRRVAQVQKDIYDKTISPMSTKESFLYTRSKEVR